MPPPSRDVENSASRCLEIRAAEAMLEAYELFRQSAELSGDEQTIRETTAMVNRKRAHLKALRSGDEEEIPRAQRQSARTVRAGLNRHRRDFGLRPLPMRPPLLRLATCEQRNRRAPGRKSVKRPGSRRTTAPTRGDPDPDGDLPPPAPGPGARWQALLGAELEPEYVSGCRLFLIERSSR